jgi:hypothetical protein
LDSPYQHASALKLAPELRIQQMDNDCLAIELNEEV